MSRRFLLQLHALSVRTTIQICSMKPSSCDGDWRAASKLRCHQIGGSPLIRFSSDTHQRLHGGETCPPLAHRAARHSSWATAPGRRRRHGLYTAAPPRARHGRAALGVALEPEPSAPRPAVSSAVCSRHRAGRNLQSRRGLTEKSLRRWGISV